MENRSTDAEEVLEVTLAQYRIVKVLNILVVVSLFILAIGGVWAIGDIFSQNKFGEFLNLSIYSQIFIIGIILLGLFMLSIFLTAIYRRGQEMLLRFLFSQSKVKKTIEKFYTTKIVLIGWVLSVSAIFVGFIIAFFEFIFQTSETGILISIANLTGGVRILLFGSVFFLILVIAILLIWVSQNGYHFIFEKIISKHESVKIEQTYTAAQNNIATGIYATYYILIVSCIFGIIWSVFDAIMPTGKWTIFLSYSLGTQVVIISSFSTLFFVLLIISILMLKSGMKTALLILYRPKKSTPKQSGEIIKSAKIAASGILISLFLIIFAIVVWVISIIFDLSIGRDFGNIFEALGTLSGGLFLTSVSILCIIFISLFLLFIYIFNNGYDLLANRISSAQASIEQNLGGVQAKTGESKRKKTIKIVK